MTHLRVALTTTVAPWGPVPKGALRTSGRPSLTDRNQASSEPGGVEENGRRRGWILGQPEPTVEEANAPSTCATPALSRAGVVAFRLQAVAKPGPALQRMGKWPMIRHTHPGRPAGSRGGR